MDGEDVDRPALTTAAVMDGETSSIHSPKQEEDAPSARGTPGPPDQQQDVDAETPPRPAQAPLAVKRKRFFAKSDDEGEQSAGQSDQGNAANGGDNASARKKKRDSSVVEILDDSDGSDADMQPVASTSRIDKTPEPAKPRIQRDGKDFKGEKYFGSFKTEAWATVSSNKDVFKDSKKVKIERPAVSAVTAKKQTGTAVTAKEKDANAIVRIRNSQDREVGRIEQKNAAWMAKAIDLGLARFEGIVLEAPKNLSSGMSTIKLSVRTYIQRNAFMALQAAVDLTAVETPEKPKQLKADKDKGKPKKATFFDESRDTDAEAILRARKVAINKLFDKLRLQPVFSDDILKKHKKKGKLNSKRAILEHYDTKSVNKLKNDKEKKDAAAKKAKRDGKGKAKADEVEEEEGAEISAEQVNEVFAKASKNDKDLPEREPPASFALTLRPYQKQALHWMSAQEGAAEDAREEYSMHPLWEEYAFPAEDNVIDIEAETEPFFYSPYSGELSLEFPRASKHTRGGILADEMGLGKTIMVAALIQTNKPKPPKANGKSERQTNPTSSSSEDSAAASGNDSDKPYVPSPVRKVKRQTKLGATDIGDAVKPSSRAGRHSATLVVAPTSLLNQWKEELLRTSKEDLSVVVYNDQKDDSNLQDELDSGIDIVIASYGKIGVEFEKYAGEDGKGIKKRPKRGLYSVDWFRIILDEAHTIKSRRTPIVNRLEDLYSLFHFIRCEPWGNWAFFKTYITEPYKNGDQSAVYAIQSVLEDLLLRREKWMKDKDGNPLVPLPKKKIIMKTLDLSTDERRIYEKVFEDGKRRYLSFAENGTVKRNTIAILAIITRLRQACLHPTLLLKTGSKAADPSGLLVRNMVAKWIAKGTDTEAADEILEDLNESDEELQPVCMHCDDIAEDPVFFPCEHSGCKGCMVTYLTEDHDGEAICPKCNKGPTYTVKNLHQAVRQATTKRDRATARKSDVIDLDDSDDEARPNPTATKKPLFRARSESTSSDDASTSDAQDKKAVPAKVTSIGGKNWLKQSGFVPSTKIKALLTYLEEFREEEDNFHAVVFSQFTSFLDLIEIALSESKFRFVRLDGTMDRKQRAAAVKKFNDLSRHCVFIISLKAGGTGLNLTAANRILVLDWWWASAVENQAIDRVHRYGQEREVYVYRFMTKNSIERKMKRIQVRKDELVDTSLGKESVGGTEEDFQDIFGDENYDTSEAE